MNKEVALTLAREKKSLVREQLKHQLGIIGIGIGSIEEGKYSIVVNVLQPHFEEVEKLVIEILGDYPYQIRSFSEIPKAQHGSVRGVNWPGHSPITASDQRLFRPRKEADNANE